MLNLTTIFEQQHNRFQWEIDFESRIIKTDFDGPSVQATVIDDENRIRRKYHPIKHKSCGSYILVDVAYSCVSGVQKNGKKNNPQSCATAARW